MSKHYDDEFNNSSRAFSSPVLITTGVVSALVLVVLMLVLVSNSAGSGRNNLRNNALLNPQTTSTPQSAEDVARSYTDAYGNKDIEALYRDGKLRAEDLDIWDMYGDGGRIIIHNEPVEEDNTLTAPESTTPEALATPSDTSDSSSWSEASPTPTPSDIPDGLLEDVKPNSLDFTALKTVNSKMHYYRNDESISKLGVEISERSGIVDFRALRDNDIDFVMLRVGSRGYDSGVINIDSNFTKNLKAADEAGLKIGLIFSSRAVSEREAVDEANYAIDQAGGVEITYPIAFEFEGKLFDEARTDILDAEDMTLIADAFMKQVRSRGYEPILYADEDYLLWETEPEKLLKYYSVMLDDQSNMPTYPYQFVMWKYLNNALIPGVEKNASYIMSLIDYAGR